MNAAFCAAAMMMQVGCGKAGTPPSLRPPPPDIQVMIAPTNASVTTGGAQEFTATVTGNGGQSADVTWSVNSAAGGNSTVGLIASSSATTALYTAPATVPAPSTVTVTATSVADSAKSASATVTITCGAASSISPSVSSIALGQQETLTASFCLAAGANIAWDVNGIANGNSTLGTITAAGSMTAVYAAPTDLPGTNPVTIHAIASAVTGGAASSASATVTITCGAASSISPSVSSVALGQQETLTASFCLAAGASIAWDVNGIASGNSTLGTITATGSMTAVYTAPTDLPGTNPVTIHAIASAVTGGAAPSASATVTITSGVGVSVTPSAATLSPGQRQSFAATVANSTDTAVMWTVNGVPNGDAAVGQVCVSGTSPCIEPGAPASGAVDYLAPATAPSVNPVTLTATSHADPSRSAAASIAISVPQGPVSVAISPAYAFLARSTGTPSTQQFTATVTNSANSNVTWSVQSGVTGQGCAGAACGTVSASGLYTAPAAAPSPNAIAVVATSAADPTKSATATVVIASGPAIESLLPSSVMAGAVESFPLEVKGVGFVAGSGTGASVILLNGTPRATSCASATTCTTALNSADVQSAGTFTVQVQNPGNPPPLSNLAPFVVAPFDVSVGTITLTSSQPVSAGDDIVVTEPTTAAESSPINVDFVGYLTGGNSCGVQGSPLTIARPASGTAVASICVHGADLDPTFTYAFSGPGGAPGGDDIGVTASAITGLFSNLIELDLQISSSTQPGVRTLFITTLNNDRAVATGMVEVK